MESDSEIEQKVKETLRKEYQEFNPIEKYGKDEIERYNRLREAWVNQNYKSLNGNYGEKS